MFPSATNVATLIDLILPESATDVQLTSKPLPNGNLLMSWTIGGENPTAIGMMVVDNAGAVVTPELTVPYSTDATLTTQLYDIVMDTNGHFTVVRAVANSFGLSNALVAQKYDANGVPLGAEAVLHTLVDEYYRGYVQLSDPTYEGLSTVAMADGGFAIASEGQYRFLEDEDLRELSKRAHHELILVGADGSIVVTEVPANRNFYDGGYKGLMIEALQNDQLAVIQTIRTQYAEYGQLLVYNSDGTLLADQRVDFSAYSDPEYFRTVSLTEDLVIVYSPKSETNDYLELNVMLVSTTAQKPAEYLTIYQAEDAGLYYGDTEDYKLAIHAVGDGTFITAWFKGNDNHIVLRRFLETGRAISDDVLIPVTTDIEELTFVKGAEDTEIGLQLTTLDTDGSEAFSFVGLTIASLNHVDSTDGDDIINGTGDDDSFAGMAGDDTLYGEGGDDFLFGASGNDFLYGNEGNDKLAGGSGIDTAMYSGARSDYSIDENDDGTFTVTHTGDTQTDGADTLISVEFAAFSDKTIELGVAESLNLVGTNASETLTGDASDDVIRGGAGDDRIVGLDGADLLAGNTGKDTILGGDGADRMFGGADADLLVGGEDNDTGNGGAGDDRLYGNNGNDTLIGDDGADEMSGGNGNDRLFGGKDNDQMSGGTGADTMAGNLGNDTMLGGSQDDLMFGGGGNDLVNGEDGSDALNGGDGDDLVLGRSGEDVMRGGNHDDRLYGGADDDLIAGNLGDDDLHGGSGNDVMFGGGGNDHLIGGRGRDTQTGGAGADVFIFTSVADSLHGSARDTIADFTHGEDQIDLSKIMSGLSFIGTDTYSKIAGEVRYNDTIGRLYIDVTGDGESEFSIAISGVPTIDSGDLIL